jgi:hypothetical protein
MSIEFDEYNYTQVSDQSKAKTGSKMGDWLVRMGIAKNAFAANLILTIVAVLIFALSIYFFMYGFNLPQKTVTPVNNTNLPGLEV